MRLMQVAALAAALAGGALIAGPAWAAPVSAGLAATGDALDTPATELVQYYGYGGGYGGGYRRRGYGGYGGGYGFRPRVVCRVRYTPFGPRRVCFRR